MRRQSRFHTLKNRKSQKGMSLVETMVALAMLLIVAAGVLSLGGIALATTENQGHLAARTAEYAQDKMEQLLVLRYLDVLTDTTVFPSAITGNGTGLTVGGSLNPNAPVAGYSDYLDATGNIVGAGANWEYIRVWQVTQNAAQNLKTVSVLSRVRAGVGQPQVLPQSTIVALKSLPF
jgi:prepilin-type N-terminal cleavage/methylation domain-containing protein